SRALHGCARDCSSRALAARSRARSDKVPAPAPGNRSPRQGSRSMPGRAPRRRFLGEHSFYRAHFMEWFVSEGQAAALADTPTHQVCPKLEFSRLLETAEQLYT